MSAKEKLAEADALARRLPPKPVDSAISPCKPETKVRLRLVIRDGVYGICGHMKYELLAGEERFSGITGDNGLIDHLIADDARQAGLRVWPGEGKPVKKWRLELGKLKPVSTIEGLQSRLNNLGFEAGEADGELGPITRHALSNFQARFSLKPDGECDAATRSRLETAYLARQEQPPGKGSWQSPAYKPVKRSKNRAANTPVSRVGDE